MHSPFTRFLFSNYAPNTSEASKIAEFCSKLALELEELDEGRIELQEAVDLITLRRKKIEDVIRSHRALLSPERQMPVEIMQRIFLFCLHSKRNPVIHHAEAPLLLGRICRRWRSIVMNTAELWASIHIVASDGLASRTDRLQTEHIVRWLGRSGFLPLDISLYVLSSPNPTQSSDSHFLASILPYSSRWRHIKLEMSRFDLRPLQDVESKVPLLQTFVFRDTCSNIRYMPVEDLPLERSLAFLKTAAMLRGIYLPRFFGSIIPVNLPWQYLIELDQRVSLGTTTLLNLLKDCTHLQKCTTQHTADILSFPVSEHSITLPRLQSLCLSSWPYLDGPEDSCILNFITTPSLRSLEFSNLNYREVLPTISSLLERSHCSIQKLILRHAHHKPEELLDCLRLTPDLRELDIPLPPTFISPGPGVTPASAWSIILHALTASASEADSNQHCLCPNLRMVSFNELHLVILPNLLGFLNSRAHPPPGVSHLESIRLAFLASIGPGEHADIQRAADGVTITVNPPAVPEWHDRWAGLHEDAH